MEFRTNKKLLVFLFLCIVLFTSAQAICVPRNQTVSEGGPGLSSSFSASSKSHSQSSPASTPTSQPPPSPPPPSTAPAPVSVTPPSPPSPSTASDPVPATPTIDSSPGLKLPKIQLPLSPLSSNLGVGAKTVTDPQILSLCGKTDHAALCLACIAPFYNGKSDLSSVVEMLIKSGTEQTKQAIAIAAKMADDPKSDPKTVAKLNDCKEIYDDALDNMQEAIDAIPLKDLGTIATMISATISDFGTCDDGFTGQPNPIPEGVSPMAKINENLMNIAGIILVLADMIH
ncbi:pectinesterase inhibitor [Herrania umbratica]|uniref:Pectinesterase inhibitor n=1 Tax=Herrania umbratica TaxID=108875 RepID=A0A6J1AWB3_9ROSI|nr:pectinesterase inhibitor [Herrania umbratica]